MKNADKPAYPTEVAFNDGEPSESYQTSEHTGIFPGLTKREYFAAMAMQGLLSSFTVKASIGNWMSESSDVAAFSLHLADELLKHLES